jgi:cobyrinic acid a,c-diamide synthase
MSSLSRLAAGTIQAGTDRRCIVGALYATLARRGIHVQPFLSRACFCPCSASALARQTPRHLDSWLMSREVCGELFAHGARDCDVAIVEGEFQPASALDSLYPSQAASPGHEAGGACLETLCQWLDLPVLAVVDASKIDGCAMPIRPRRLAGVLLDRVSGRRAGERWRTILEALWDVPVLGVLEEVAHLRSMVEGAEMGAAPCDGVLLALADRFEESLQLDLLLRAAEQRPLAAGSPDEAEFASCTQGGSHSPSGAPLRVAVAYDNAFHCYFPDTLDLLEARGARLCDFSPLRDEALPDEVDVVYLGCGCPEKYADPLSENHCMKQALRSFAAGGGRIYAEAGGLAYLCQQIVLPTGRRLPMVGALPAVASRASVLQAPQPAEATMRANNWLAERGSRLRGYLNVNWRIQPIGPLTSLAKEEPLHTALIGKDRVIGSRLHLNFAAQPSFLRRFFQPIPLATQAAAKGV